MDIEQIKQKYRNLPQYMRDAIAAFDVSAVVQEIGKEHRLHIDQTGELAHEINGVLIGDVEREVFLPNIKKKLGIDDETAKEIVQEVNENIFIPIKEDMRKRKEGEDTDEEKDARKIENKRSTQPVASVDNEALAQIEKDKYREPIDNEDIAFDATGVPTDNPSPTAPQAETPEEPVSRASMLKEIEDAEEPPEKEEREPRPSVNKDWETSTSTQQEEATPRASMVRNLMDKKATAGQRKPKLQVAEDETEQNTATPEVDKAQEPAEEVKQPPTREKENASAAEKINTPPAQGGEVKKDQINNDPYREPIE